jgi:hypothetical protein
MKALFVFSGLLSFGQVTAWELTPEDIYAQNEGLARLRETAGELAENPSTELKLKLAEGLRKTAMPSIYSIDETVEVHQLIKNALIAVPGHALSIAAEVERLRQESTHLGRGNQASYDFKRQILIDETLRHLPSPETLKVLGNYLYDERDLPPKITFLPENAFLACRALTDLGIRDAPVKSRPGFSSWKESVTKQRAWYAQVKAGTLPFSFVGQKVEYRFKPDGSWETIAMVNPPDDAPKSRQVAMVEEVRQPKKQRPTESEATRRRADQTPWLWLLAAGCLIVAGGLLAKRIKA